MSIAAHISQHTRSSVSDTYTAQRAMDHGREDGRVIVGPSSPTLTPVSGRPDQTTTQSFHAVLAQAFQ